MDEKRKLLQKRVLKTAILSSITFKDSMPGTSVRRDMLLFEVDFYEQQFGTDDNSLKIIADKMKTTFNDLKKLNIRSTSSVCSIYNFNSVSGDFKRCGGRITGPVISFVTTIGAIAFSVKFQVQMINICYDEALRIIAAQQNILSGKPM
ncbi:hypothetical protein DPMN_172632 [Dreissena polymorpha]|uniref:Uncharacterized protein n=1 Tax=Dreissena polymorpha TaxID=45954 RepID=A0A9D4IGT0_DREPO|nr:hypothetical protein DPMN_172632 [Dreissena polymorpha]